MLASQIPLRMQKAWGIGAGGAYIRTVPVASQIGITDGAASFTDGFVPDNFTPIAAGGVPPFGQDMNGALNVITSWDQWLQAGGPIGYDATFSAAIGGYPFGAILDSSITFGAQWISSLDNNLTNPDDPLTSVGWSRVGAQPGTPTPLFTNNGFYILANGQTVGSAASGSTKAAKDFLFVFKAIWDQFSNSQCPIFDSGGGVSARGANAVADFNANKRLVTPNMKGLGVIGVDTMGGTASTFLSGVPITTGNTVTPGSILGENLHTLALSEIAAHNHGVNETPHLHGFTSYQNSGGGAGIGTGGVAQSIATSTTNTNTASTGISTQNAGSGGSHNTVERNMTVLWGLSI